MSELQQYMKSMLQADMQKIVISNPISKSAEYKRIVIENKGKNYQIAFPFFRNQKNVLFCRRDSIHLFITSIYQFYTSIK